jgi:hypothetical protein
VAFIPNGTEDGALPTGMVVVVPVATSITDTVPPPKSVTYAVAPSGLNATEVGTGPTEIGAPVGAGGEAHAVGARTADAPTEITAAAIRNLFVIARAHLSGAIGNKQNQSLRKKIWVNRP